LSDGPIFDTPCPLTGMAKTAFSMACQVGLRVYSHTKATEIIEERRRVEVEERSLKEEIAYLERCASNVDSLVTDYDCYYPLVLTQEQYAALSAGDRVCYRWEDTPTCHPR